MEQIVMTPKCKTANSTTLIIERQTQSIESNGDQKNIHVAGGDHKGIVINKQLADDNKNVKPSHLSLQFKVFLINAQSGNHTQESRTLQFWFSDNLPDDCRPTVAQEFFKELVSPQEFPRDYVGFIKKIMKLIQHKYLNVQRVEIELKQIEEPVELPIMTPSSDENTGDSPIIELTTDKLLELIESAYPNPVTIPDLADDYGWEITTIKDKLEELQKKDLVLAMDNGAYTRVAHKDNQIKVVKQMPVITSSKQPTIAIITAQYCEKLAVDAMIENKETFVRYTTVGESNVYTLGDIGAHRIVCTKLPTVGHTREAITAAGNTTTRLLGTFQKVDYVFLVGVGGGVPHYTDYKKHVRLGDVVISCPLKQNNKFVYVYCENANIHDDGSYKFETKEYCPTNLGLQDIATNLKRQVDDGSNAPWQNHMNKGLKILASQSEHNFDIPPADSDKLYMNIGEKDLIEVSHPSIPKEDLSFSRDDGCPQVHLSPVASGRKIARDDQLRQKFASRFGVLAFDAEMDAVVESILGNCRESFTVVRGIADYKDGSRGKEWQPYASLAAASVVKAMISSMDPPSPMKN